MGLIWQLIIGGVIGAVAGALTSRNLPMGWIGNIIAGFLGSWLGGQFLPEMGPEVAGFALIPSIIGAVVLVVLTSFIFSNMNK